MTSELALTTEIWELVRDFVPVSKRDDIALGIVQTLVDYGFESKEMAELQDEDRHLAKAYLEIFGYEDDYDDHYGDE